MENFGEDRLRKGIRLEAKAQVGSPLMVVGTVEREGQFNIQFSRERMRALLKEESMGMKRREWI